MWAAGSKGGCRGDRSSSYPARQPSLLFAGLAMNEQKYIEAWKELEPDPTNEEVQRSIPIRQPVLWVD
jgi:hypothetical protein